MVRTLDRALPLAVAVLLPPVRAADELGVVAEHHKIDPNQPVAATLPELSIDDLRRITMYSHLQVRGSKLQIADREHMRHVEPHPRHKDVLVVTSDHFRFGVVRHGVPPQAGSPFADRRRQFRFLWVKHATREPGPDGNPWLKDLLLVPFNQKTWKLLSGWPGPSRNEPFALNWMDARAEWNGFPPPEERVVGVPLRGKDAKAIDRFHERPRSRQARGWASISWPDGNRAAAAVARDVASARRVREKADGLYRRPADLDPGPRWRDLLRLEKDSNPVFDIHAGESRIRDRR